MLRRWLGRSERTARRAVIRPGDRGFEVASDLTVLEAALRRYLSFPLGGQIGICGTFECRLLAGKGRDLFDEAHALWDEAIRAGCRNRLSKSAGSAT